MYVNVSVSGFALNEDELSLLCVALGRVAPTVMVSLVVTSGFSLNQSPLKVILVDDFPLRDVGVVGGTTTVEVDGLVRVTEDDVVIAIASVLEFHLGVSLVDTFPEGNVVTVSVRATVLMKDMIVLFVQGRDNVEITTVFSWFEVPLEVVLVDVTPSRDVGTVCRTTTMNMYVSVSSLALDQEGFTRLHEVRELL